MKLSKRTNAIILWVISIGLLVSMVIAFTPGTFFGGNQGAQQGATALQVNGQPIPELEVARLQQNPPFSSVQEGPVAEDLERLALDQLIQNEVLRQAAADVNVSRGEVRAEVNEFREARGVAGSNNDQAYQNLLRGAGYTDATFRELIRQQLKQEKYLEQLAADVEVTDEEVQTFFEANRDAYVTDPQIAAREIVVADQNLANDLYARARAGEDFAALAREFSTERAERGGAIGAAEGGAEPRPVGRIALPTPVADAAFGLQGTGVTRPVQAGGAYHIVKVEAFTPSEPQPLDAVQAEVREDAQLAKEAGVQQQTLDTLRDEANIEIPSTSPYSYDNPPVAFVGEDEIGAVALAEETYLNQQVQQFLNPNSADIILNFFKPTVLEQIIERELADQGAAALDANFIGPPAGVAQSALSFVSRDAEATDAQIQEYYDANQGRFTESAVAVATRVNFADEASAQNFRQALLDNENVDRDAINVAADAAGGEVVNLGPVAPGETQEVVDQALFNFESGDFTALNAASEVEVSGVLTLAQPADAQTGGAETGGETGGSTDGAATGGAETGAAGGADAAQTYVVLVATRVPERVRPLEEVRTQAREAVLANNREELRQAWLSGLREEITVENLLVPAQGEATGGGEEGASPAAGGENEGGESEGAGNAGGSAEEGAGGGAEGQTEEQPQVPNDTELVPAEEGTQDAPPEGQ